MTYFGKTYSDTKPQEVEILESMVYVAKNIEPITRQIDETHTLNGFQYDYYGYTKDEYIKKMDEANHLSLAVTHIFMNKYVAMYLFFFFF